MARTVATAWIGTHRLDDRLDARAFKPWVLFLIDKCTEFPQGTIALGRKPECVFLARGVGSAVSTPGRFAVYKAKEVGEFAFYDPESYIQSCPDTKVLQNDDVVLTSSGIGTIGRAALFDGTSPKGSAKAATVDNHVSIIRLKGKQLFPPYVCAFLNSSPGKAWSEWGTTGSTRLLELSVDKVTRFRIPLPDVQVQEYIGSRVTLSGRFYSEAQHLRARASDLLRREWHLDEIQKDVARLSRKQAHLVAPDVLSDRWDAGFYQPWHLHIADELDQRDCWKLGDLIHPPVKGVQPTYEQNGTIPALTVTHIDPFIIDRRNAEQAVTTNWLDSNERARVCSDEVLITVTGPPLGEAAVVEDFHLPASVNSDIARIRMRSSFPFPNLLAAMLNSLLGQWQTVRFCKGVRQKHLYPEDLLGFRFPKLPARALEGLENDFRTACVLLEKARGLVDEAKADVETLVDGTLDIPAILSGRLKAPTHDSLMQAISTKGAR